VKRRPAWLGLAVLGATLARSTPASATAKRTCEARVTAEDGATLTQGADGFVHVSAESAVEVVVACTDHVSVSPSSSHTALVPPELALETVTECRAADGTTATVARSLGALEPVDDNAAPFGEPGAKPHRWRGRLAAGRHDLRAAGSPLRLALLVEGTPQATPLCPPSPPIGPPLVSEARDDQPPRAQAAETPSAPETTNWDDRRGWVWEAAAGAWVGATDGRRVGVAGVAAFGLHRMVRYARHRSEKGGDLPESDATRWCASLGCLGLGLLFMPPGVLLGNELGVDARFVAHPDLARGSLKPVLRFSSGRLRTTSFVGALLPELGVQSRAGTGTDAAISWSVFPIDIRIASGLALGLDPLRAGLLVHLDRRGVDGDLGGELTLRFAP
jgi:hypothetical protein